MGNLNAEPLDIFNAPTPVKKYVPDNEYLRFVKLPSLLKELEVGQILCYPLKARSLFSMKTGVSKYAKKVNGDFRIRTNAKEGVYEICRFA